jgi:hypothetical protein
MADESIPGKVSDGLDRLLFGPVYLVAEVISSVLPGLLFYLILLLNRNQLALSLFHVDFIGYRTKLLLVVFIAYMIGKAFGIPHAIVAPMIWERLLPLEINKKKKKDENEILQYLAAGAIALPTFFGPSRILDHLVLGQAMLVFNFSSGMALIVGGLLPGDSTYRAIELIVGTCFLAASIVGQKPFVGAVAAAAAHSMVEFAFRIPLANWPILIKVVEAVLTSRKTPISTTGDASSVQATKETLQQDTPVSTPTKPPIRAA